MNVKATFNISTAPERRLAVQRLTAAAGWLRYLIVGLRRRLFARWLDRNRSRLALLELEEEHLSQIGCQTRRDIRRELIDRIRFR